MRGHLDFIELKCIAAAPSSLESEVVYKKYTVQNLNRPEHLQGLIQGEMQANNDVMARPVHDIGHGYDEEED